MLGSFADVKKIVPFLTEIGIGETKKRPLLANALNIVKFFLLRRLTSTAKTSSHLETEHFLSPDL